MVGVRVTFMERELLSLIKFFIPMYFFYFFQLLEGVFTYNKR